VEIEFLGKALDDIDYWKKSGNKSIQKRITKLLDSIRKTPWSGIGKPEPLKHRIVYTVSDNRIKVISMRFHYR